MATAIIYTRVSTEDQVNGLSLTSQENACNEFAARNGYTIREIFREEGASAKTTDRKKLIQLLDYCKKNKGAIDALIVWKVDRFARRSEDHHTLRAYLTRLGVSLVSVTEPIEDSNTGRLMESMLAAFAQFDNEVRTERASNGLRGRAEEGGWISYAPLGYFNTRDAQRRPTLKVDPIRAEYIKKIFKEYATGRYTLMSIGQYAYELGLRTRAGNRLHKQPMSNLLRNPAFKGYRKSKVSGEMIKCLHTPLIPERLFEEVQDVLNGKSKEHRPDKDADWPLRGGFLLCSCGNPLTGSRVKGNTRYYAKYNCPVCRTSVTGKPTSIDRDKLHGEFKALLKCIAPKKRHAELFKRVVISKWNDEYKDMAEEQKRAESDLKKLQGRRDRILDLFIDGSLNKDEKDAQFDKIDRERALLRIKLSELNQDIDNRDEVVEVALDFMVNISSYWERSPLSVQRRFQRLVFPEGIIYELGNGFRTPKLGYSYEVVGDLGSKNRDLAGEEGLVWNLLRSNLLEIYGVVKKVKEENALRGQGDPA